MQAAVPLACFLSLIRPPGIQYENAVLQIAPVDKAKCPFIKDTNDVGFLLYTRHNPTVYQELVIGDDEKLFASNMDFHDTTVFYFHAWMEQPEDGSAVLVREAYMQRGDTNVIMVDARHLEAGPWYFTAAQNTWYIGRFVAQFVDYLVTRGLNLNNTHFVGHSLGAQAAGVAGSALQSGRVARITGLDPALPLFDKLPLKQRLDPEDAQFVDIIHTDAGIFGYKSPMGHADFYPNGGISPQPGCELEVVIPQQLLLNKCDKNIQTRGIYTYYLKTNGKHTKTKPIEHKLEKLINHIQHLKTKIGNIKANKDKKLDFITKRDKNEDFVANNEKNALNNTVKSKENNCFKIKDSGKEKTDSYLSDKVQLRTKRSNIDTNNNTNTLNNRLDAINNTFIGNYNINNKKREAVVLNIEVANKDVLSPELTIKSIATNNYSNVNETFKDGKSLIINKDSTTDKIGNTAETINKIKYYSSFDEILKSKGFDKDKNTNKTNTVATTKSPKLKGYTNFDDPTIQNYSKKNSILKPNQKSKLKNNNFKIRPLQAIRFLATMSRMTQKIRERSQKNSKSRQIASETGQLKRANSKIRNVGAKIKQHVLKRQKRFLSIFQKSEENDSFLFKILDFLVKNRKNVLPVLTVMREVNTLIKSANGELSHFIKESNNYVGVTPSIVPVTYNLELGGESKLSSFFKRLIGLKPKGDSLTITGR